MILTAIGAMVMSNGDDGTSTWWIGLLLVVLSAVAVQIACVAIGVAWVRGERVVDEPIARP